MLLSQDSHRCLNLTELLAITVSKLDTLKSSRTCVKLKLRLYPKKHIIVT